VGLISAAVVAAVLMICPATGAGSTGPDGVRVTNQQQITSRVLELTVETPAFVAPTRLHVNLPVGYNADPARRWPVTYFTAGTMNRYSAFNEQLDGEELTEDYPSIVVSPDANSGYWSDWFNAGQFGPPMYETFVIEQLIPLIDGRFRTIPNRSHRAIFGISMGGYGAMMLAARHPDLFSAAASLSGAVDSNIPTNGAVLSLSSTFDGAPANAIYGPRLTQEVRWRGHNPTDLAANLRGLHLQVRSANGTLNPALGEGGDPNDVLSCAVEAGTWAASINLHEAFEELGINHSWTDYGDGCHSRGNFLREVRDTLEAFALVFDGPPAKPARVDFRSFEPDFRIWGWRVKAESKRALEFMRLRVAGPKLSLEGSGLTSVTSPPRYRGLKRVSVGDDVIRVGSDGRLRFKVNLGRAHETQQYTPGAVTEMTRRTVKLKPHAEIRISRAEWASRRLRLCAQSIGGSVPRPRIAGGLKLRRAITPAPRCFKLRFDRRPERVVILGRDRFGHPVRAGAGVS
jgi:S-formylglutathione hydrolase FrmB